MTALCTVNILTPLFHCKRAREGDSMTIRNRAASVAAVALVCGASLGTTGCGKYSWGTLSAVKSFKDANLEYARKDWKKEAEKYEDVVKHEDAINKYEQLQTAYFFLANSYDQL